MPETDSPSKADSPLIVGFVADLMFATRIEQRAESLGFRVRWIERTSQLAPPPDEPAGRPVAEALSGPGAVLIQRLADWQPALLIFDLGNAELPWQEWITLLKSSPATRRIPVICYGSHVDAGALAAARAAGAETVLARSRFMADLAELIQEHARLPETAAIQSACGEPLLPAARRGLELFNRGEFFEAHEELELAWNQDATPGRELYRAILQVAVAYLHIERGNYNGATKMFLRLRQWIDPLPDVCRGVEVARLRGDVLAAQAQLAELGPERIARFDRRLFRPVVYQVPEE